MARVSLPRHARRWLAAGCAACGVAWAYASGVDAAHAVAATRWPTAPGRVITSTIVTVYKGWTNTRLGTVRVVMDYHWDVRYAYAVDGRPYEGERVDLTTSGRRRRVSRDQARYPEGAAVAVHYDPADPHSAVLDAGLPFGLLLSALCGVVVALVGVRYLIAP